MKEIPFALGFIFILLAALYWFELQDMKFKKRFVAILQDNTDEIDALRLRVSGLENRVTVRKTRKRK